MAKRKPPPVPRQPPDETTARMVISFVIALLFFASGQLITAQPRDGDGDGVWGGPRRNLLSIVTSKTSCQSVIGKPPLDLDVFGTAIQCGSNSETKLMSGFQLTPTTCSGGLQRYEIKCVSPVTDYSLYSSCVRKFTGNYALAGLGNNKVDNMDRHAVTCSAGTGDRTRGTREL